MFVYLRGTGRYISLTPSPWTTPMDLVHGLLELTTRGLPMDYPKWTTLKFVANINLTMLEPEQKMRSIDKHNYGTLAM